MIFGRQFSVFRRKHIKNEAFRGPNRDRKMRPDLQFLTVRFSHVWDEFEPSLGHFKGDINNNNNNNKVLVARGGPKTTIPARTKHTREREFRRPSTKMLRGKHVKKRNNKNVILT